MATDIAILDGVPFVKMQAFAAAMEVVCRGWLHGLQICCGAWGIGFTTASRATAMLAGARPVEWHLQRCRRG